MIHNLGPFRLNPKGAYSSTEQYKLLDSVTFNGSTWVCANLDYIGGVTFSGIEPGSEDPEDANVHWIIEAERGEQGPKADKYDNFLRISDEQIEESDNKINISWNYEDSDKIIIESDPNYVGKDIELFINNPYDGCCGMIITRLHDLILPENSDYALDFDYINIGVKQYYVYTFVYCKVMNTYRFVWNRTVVQGIEEL